MTTPASSLYSVAGRAIAPRRQLTVSEWADENRILSAKGSTEAGRWRTERNPLLREPMDCMSAHSPVRGVVCMFPIQFGKSEFETNVIGYTMTEVGGPIMAVLPSEVSLNKFVNQKLTPLFETTPAVRDVLTSTKSRESANQREFKDFAGGQLYIEHAGSPVRLKSTSVRTMLLDEVSEIVSVLSSMDDPWSMVMGRLSAFPVVSKWAAVGTPGINGLCRVVSEYEASDQRVPMVPCPHCGHEQYLIWSGLHWDVNASGDVTHAWYVCEECAALIEEHHKQSMMARHRWVPRQPGRKVRGYTANCLYYQFGLGPRWAELAQEWINAQNDPARLKTFVNDRLAEGWEDPAMRAVKHNAIADRAEPYRLRTAPAGVLFVTAGVDTQDDRLEGQIVGWGRGGRRWVLDYFVLPGDPAGADVWVALTDVLNRPIEHESGALLPVQATAIDAGGHRTEHVYHYCRQRLIRRPMPIFGAKPNNAPPLNKGTMVDVTWRGVTDKRGLRVYQVGTVRIKHDLYSRLSNDASIERDQRACHFSDELPPEYFAGLVSEKFNPAKNRFEKGRGARNEPLDTHTYATAATYHPEIRMHKFTGADWDRLERQLPAVVAQAGASQPQADPADSSPTAAPRGRRVRRRLG